MSVGTDEKVERTCPVCGSVYMARRTRLRWGRETTCGRACSYLLRGSSRQCKHWLPCAVCGKQVERAPSQIKNKNGLVFCSRGCHYSGRSLGLVSRTVVEPYRVDRSPAARKRRRVAAAKTRKTRIERNNYKHTDETRAKLSKATASYLARTWKPYARSKLELKVERELKRIGAVFTPQAAFRDTAGRYAFVVDFRLSNGVVLEVNGTYWHADPRTYPEGPKTPAQRRTVRLYTRKLEALGALGVRVVELWEADLRKNMRKTVRCAYAEATRH